MTEIEKLKNDLETAWEHNRILQSVLSYAKQIGHDIDGWFEKAFDDIEDDFCYA